MRGSRIDPSHEMKINEIPAHAIVLAQAVESVDTQGKLLTDVERDQIDARVAKQHRVDSVADANIGELLAARANVLLEIVRGRNQAVDLILGSAHVRRVSLWLIPMVTLIVGIAIDRVLNPQRVDLLSETFLGLLIWNFVVYLMLAWSAFRGDRRQPSPFFEFVRRWFSTGPAWRLRRSHLAAEISISFIQRWNAMTDALAGQRLRLVMHLAAAAWGLGMALSLILRGMFKSYKVGWESTLWDIQTVHRILGALSWPLTKILGTTAFSVDDIARLQFEVGSGANTTDGRRWIWLYVGILILFVVLPRLGLAMIAAWRGRQLAINIPIDIGDAYFQRLIGNLVPATVRLGLLVHEPDDRAAIRKILIQEQTASSNAKRSPQGEQRLISTDRGDTMWMAELSESNVRTISGFDSQESQGILRTRRLFSLLSASSLSPENQADSLGSERIDVVGHVVSQASHLADALPMLQALRRPVLMLVRSDRATNANVDKLIDECERHKHSHDLTMEVLQFDEFSKCWVLERSLLNLIARHVPRSKSRGCARLIGAWERRNRQRFQDSMSEISSALEFSVRQFVEIPKLSLLDRASTDKRRAHDDRKKAAMDAIREKVKQRDEELVDRLRELHGLGSEVPLGLHTAFESDRFATTEKVSVPAAVMGGAGTGAAMGASIDAMTGGMTLGAAAALGALTGGSVALAGIVWKNRDAPGGGLRISYSDEMLMSLLEACLHRYLLAIHDHRVPEGEPLDGHISIWNSAVHAELIKEKKEFLFAFERERKGEDIRGFLEGKIESIGRQVLLRLYPGARLGNVSEPS